MSFAVGSLVTARGREWVVLPDSTGDLVLARPLGGTDDEVAGILTALEPVRAARFDLPDPGDVGDYRSARLLRDALRLGFRSSAGPFRSFGHLGFEPRPFQLVPLLMALRLDPVRLLISDDVGIGKTVESLLIAREMLDQGEVRRLAVLCPPHLAEQWQEEMATKFQIESELVLSSTAGRLERACAVGQSLFDVHDVTVVSTDFIKSDRRRDEFLRTAPELVIIDEAHTCAPADGVARGRQQRFEMASGLAADLSRHLVLVTATPHSGKEEAFRALLSLLDPAFLSLPDDLSGEANAGHRRRLARHFVQRRRADIRQYLGADTQFPERRPAEDTYLLSPEYRALFEKVLAYARASVNDADGGQHRQRVRWWSALALLRALASSPVAAAATLRNRAAAADTISAEEADAVGRQTVLDLTDEDSAETSDAVPGADFDADSADGPDGGENPNRRRLLTLAREAEELRGDLDAKLVKAARIIKALVNDGFRPIVFCRFIATADYVAAELRERLRGVEVRAVTGAVPSSEREQAVAELVAANDKRVLVATDCLSEGINLQNEFDAVVHYDLAWNPTRHEQREGRVDRFGQPKPEVRVLTYYGADNRIDELVNEVLIRKHERIRTTLGISVPVPGDPNAVAQAVVEALLLRDDTAQQQALDLVGPDEQALLDRWDRAAEQEKRSRTVFAQHGIDTSEVQAELDLVRAAVGSGADVQHFVGDAVTAHGGRLSGTDPVTLHLEETPAALRDSLGGRTSIRGRFDLPVAAGDVHFTRAHPIVEGLASYVLDAALDPLRSSPARRAGVVRTNAVIARTVLLLVRHRFHLITGRGQSERQLLAEAAGVLAFTGDPAAAPTWLDFDRADALLDVRPDANVSGEQAREAISAVIDAYESWAGGVDDDARRRSAELQSTHERVRQGARMAATVRVEPQLPPDVLGVYVLLPVPKGFA